MFSKIRKGAGSLAKNDNIYISNKAKVLNNFAETENKALTPVGKV